MQKLALNHSAEETREGSSVTMTQLKWKHAKRSPSTPFASRGGNYHPEYMFCGECTGCGGETVFEDTSVLIDDDDEHSDSPSKAMNTTQTKLRLSISEASPEHVAIIKSLLDPLPVVSEVDVNLADSSIDVKHYDTCTDHDLFRILKRGGYPCNVVGTKETTYLEHVRNTEKEKELGKVVRSTLYVQGICCTSEVPSVRKIVKPIPGVASLQINITAKHVYVQHDPVILRAAEVADRLSEAGFPAKVVHGGGVTEAHSTDGVGQSVLRATSVLDSQDVLKIKEHLSIPGVQRVEVNLAESEILVDHSVGIVSRETVQQALLPQYPTNLVRDAEQELRDRTIALLSAPRSKYVESTIFISNLSGKHVPLLNKVIQQQYIRVQLRAVRPHVPSHTVKVEHNPDILQIDEFCSVLSKFGFEAQVVTDGGIEKLVLPLVNDNSTEEEDASIAMNQWYTNNLRFPVVLSGIFWVISMMSVLGDGFWHRLEYAGLLSVFFGLPPVAMKAFRTLRRLEFDANCMMVTAALGALCLGEFDEAASVSFLFAVSEYLEARASAKARRALSEIVSLRPDHANVIHPESKEVVVVEASKVPVGSLISVRTGDKIAADGVVIEGTSSVDESSLTGESVPVRKSPGSTVSGGTINIGTTHLIVKTTCSVENSAVSRLIRLVEEAQANRSPIEKMIDGFARAYTPGVVVLAFLMSTIPWFFGIEVGRHWTLNGLIIIVIACPCALTISTPVTYAAGLAAAAKRGIVVKGGASLEGLGSVRKVVLDKTGTLTEGKFTVTHLHELGETRTRKQMLELLALMEAPSSHPLSVTLVKAARREGVSIPPNVDVKDHSILKGEGVTAFIQNKQVYVGNRRLFERVGMYDKVPQEYKQKTDEWARNGASVGFIGVDGEGIIGCFAMTDMVRLEAKDAIQSLQEGGFDVIMLTGDGEGVATAVANQVGIPNSAVHSQLLPEDKLHFVLSLKLPVSKGTFGVFRQQPKVLFCGDGVNDGPALAAADIGVSMGEGAALALEMSDVTLMDSNLTKLIYVINMGSKVMFTVQENIILSLLCKIIVVALTFAGYMTLLYAIASDVGVMLLVTLNGMKLLPGHADESPLTHASPPTEAENIPLVSSDGPMPKTAEIV